MTSSRNLIWMNRCLQIEFFRKYCDIQSMSHTFITTKWCLRCSRLWRSKKEFLSRTSSSKRWTAGSLSATLPLTSASSSSSGWHRLFQWTLPRWTQKKWRGTRARLWKKPSIAHAGRNFWSTTAPPLRRGTLAILSSACQAFYRSTSAKTSLSCSSMRLALLSWVSKVLTPCPKTRPF